MSRVLVLGGGGWAIALALVAHRKGHTLTCFHIVAVFTCSYKVLTYKADTFHAHNA